MYLRSGYPPRHEWSVMRSVGGSRAPRGRLRGRPTGTAWSMGKGVFLCAPRGASAYAATAAAGGVARGAVAAVVAVAHRK